MKLAYPPCPVHILDLRSVSIIKRFVCATKFWGSCFAVIVTGTFLPHQPAKPCLDFPWGVEGEHLSPGLP